MSILNKFCPAFIVDFEHVIAGWEIMCIHLYKYLSEQEVLYATKFDFQTVKDCITADTFIDLSKGDTMSMK